MTAVSPRGQSGAIVAAHALAFRADKLGFLLRSARPGGGVVELKLLGRRTYLLTEPADVRHVLVTEEPRFPKNPRLVQAAEPTLFGVGLVGSSEADHRSRRLSLQPAFDGRALQPLGDVVAACVDEQLDEWSAQDDFDVAAGTIALAHRVRARVLLGGDAPDVAAEVARALSARQRYIEQAFVSPLPAADRLPTRRRRAYRSAQRRLEGILHAQLAARRSEARPGGDLLTHLLPLGDRRAFDEARGFLASYELSARGLAWTFLLLAGHPDVQSRLAREPEDEPLGYAQQVYSEALRLYPPTWLFVRMAPSDVRLPSGAAIPAGSRLFLCPWASHRDPRWFPDPECFDPERFRPGPALRERPRSAYFPFGGGRHVCIGEGFVRLEAAVALSRLARRFELAISSGGPAVPFPGATLEPRGGVRLRLRGRQSSRSISPGPKVIGVAPLSSAATE